MNKRKIRILHALARSGGTIVSRCLSCMDQIVLLSEIHPSISRYDIYNPLVQGHYWYNLLKKGEWPPVHDYDFVKAIQLLENRCSLQDKILVIRDWAHFDFLGSSVIKAAPPKKFSTNLVLENFFDIKEVALVRHPLDQWLSFENYNFLKGKYSIDTFLEGVWHFSKECVKIDFIKYEDFTENPTKYLMKLADILHIPFDHNYTEKWYNAKVTGDNQFSSRGSVLKEIKPLSRRQVSPDILKQFYANDFYWKSLKLLTYQSF